MIELGVGDAGSARAVLLDRDGTLISDPGYLNDPGGVRLLPGLAGALRRLRTAGFALVVVSNQSGLARGRITAAQHRAVHDAFVEALEREGVRLDGAFYCPHGPNDGCACRKPRPGLLLRAAERLELSLSRCWMVGDKDSDLAAARAAGCRALAAAQLLGALEEVVAP